MAPKPGTQMEPWTTMETAYLIYWIDKWREDGDNFEKSIVEKLNLIRSVKKRGKRTARSTITFQRILDKLRWCCSTAPALPDRKKLVLNDLLTQGTSYFPRRWMSKELFDAVNEYRHTNGLGKLSSEFLREGDRQDPVVVDHDDDSRTSGQKKLLTFKGIKYPPGWPAKPIQAPPQSVAHKSCSAKHRKKRIRSGFQQTERISGDHRPGAPSQSIQTLSISEEEYFSFSCSETIPLGQCDQGCSQNIKESANGPEKLDARGPKRQAIDDSDIFPSSDTDNVIPINRSKRSARYNQGQRGSSQLSKSHRQREDFKKENERLRGEIRKLRIEKEEEVGKLENQIRLLSNLLRSKEKEARNEIQRKLSIKRTIEWEPDEGVNKILRDFMARDRNADHLRDKVMAVYGSLGAKSLPDPSEMDVRDKWEDVRERIKTTFRVRDVPNRNSLPREMPNALWSDVGFLFHDELKTSKVIFERLAKRTKHWCLLRSLVGTQLCSRVFQSSFPISCEDNSRKLETLYSLIALEGGLAKVRTLDVTIHKLIMDEEQFREGVLPNKAREETTLLSRCLASFLDSGGSVEPEDFLSTGNDDDTKTGSSWLQECFERAFKLKTDLLMSSLGYEVKCFKVGVSFDSTYMEAEDESGCSRTVSPLSWMKVKLCLFPALIQYEPKKLSATEDDLTSALVSQKTLFPSPDVGKDNENVIKKAIVLVE
ncbi:hypothetical protein K469DRAFT_754680 [Zopfia rhizophila CBS 207.26]|uniref:Uncharacterized protein n=1 Tax=Zopfia rhizophila CBS 207.26 TaxID=1314779 RepID=A0A6A6DHI7_9PEZI|nr:hypothetical protein K469DRAFT_754680 [Zopfia rhizophila CBS 207.26]